MTPAFVGVVTNKTDNYCSLVIRPIRPIRARGRIFKLCNKHFYPKKKEEKSEAVESTYFILGFRKISPHYKCELERDEGKARSLTLKLYRVGISFSGYEAKAQ